MSIRSFLVAFTMLLMLLANAPAKLPAAGNDAGEIAALYRRFTTAVQQKNLDGVMSVYVPGRTLFVFDVTPPRQHVGWSDYRNDWQQLFATMKGNVRFSIADLATTIDGDVAYSHSIQHISAALAKGGTSDLVVRVTDVLRKVDGTWLIVQEHVSVPVDVSTGKADLRSSP